MKVYKSIKLFCKDTRWGRSRRGKLLHQMFKKYYKSVAIKLYNVDAMAVKLWEHNKAQKRVTVF